MGACPTAYSSSLPCHVLSWRQIVVVVWQTGSWMDDPHLKSSFFLSLQVSNKHPADADSFWFKGGVLIEGCLVPLVVSLSYARVLTSSTGSQLAACGCPDGEMSR